MNINLKYQLVPNVRLEYEPDGRLQLHTRLGAYPIHSESGALEKTLLRLVEVPMSEKEMSDHFLSENGVNELPLLYFFLEQARPGRLLDIRLWSEAGPLVAVVPQSYHFRLRTREPEPGRAYLLSRFAFARRHQNEMRLECSRAEACFTLLHPAAADLLRRLHEPLVLSDFLEGEHAHLSELVSLLLGLDYLTVTDAAGENPEEDADPRLRTWEFHDLLFHSRSRMGRHDYESGATFPFKGEMEPLPSVKPMADELPLIPLHAPSIEEVMAKDPPFSVVMEKRRSVRSYGQEHLHIDQLGEFLYRTARVRGITPRDESRDRQYEMSNRPYPNGGASYELELYITANQCEGLERGIYHYDPLRHGLRLIRKNGPYVDLLLQDAWMSAAKTVVPQVLITYAPRFQRLSWKYRGMGYSASLKNVGALYQTMYLVATAMGLAPCGLGNGNAELFCKATGNDYYLESSTAEFMLGTLPADGDQDKT